MPRADIIRLNQLRSTQGRVLTRETPAINVVNNSGGDLIYGDIVVVDPTTEKSVRTTMMAGAPNPMVVLSAGDHGQTVKCIAPFAGVAFVTCNGAAIGPGDAIITSTVAKQGKVLEAEAATGVVGIALTSKGPGTTEIVSILVGGHSLGSGSIVTIPLDHNDPSEIGNVGPSDHHAPVTLHVDLNANLLALVAQQLDLDTQNKNLIFSGPATDPAAKPTFRALTAADLPSAGNIWTRDAGDGEIFPTNLTDKVGIGTASPGGLLGIGDPNTYLDLDGSNNLTFTDVNAGTRTLKQLGCPTYKFIKATAQAEGDLHLADAVTWAVSKALVKTVRIITNSTDWDLYILQNDNGHAADDANIPEMLIMEAGSGNGNIYLDLPYEDEDDSSEVHLYYVDNSGANTADIYVIGYELI